MIANVSKQESKKDRRKESKKEDFLQVVVFQQL